MNAAAISQVRANLEAMHRRFGSVGVGIAFGTGADEDGNPTCEAQAAFLGDLNPKFLEARADDEEGSWVTINGAHVFLGKDGTIEKGPESLLGKNYLAEKHKGETEKQLAAQGYNKIKTSDVPEKVYVGTYAVYYHGYTGMKNDPISEAGLKSEVKQQFTHDSNRRDMVYVATTAGRAFAYANLYSEPMVLEIKTSFLDKGNFYTDPLGDSQQLAYRGDIPAYAIKPMEDSGRSLRTDESEHRKRELDSVQFNLAKEDADAVLAIPVDEKDFASKGRDTEPHITVLFGLLNADPVAVSLYTKNTGNIEATLGDIIAFPEHQGFEPLVIKVHSAKLKNLHDQLAMNLPYTSTHATYIPHICVAYMKPGQADKYVAAGNPLKGRKIILSDLVLSKATKQMVPLERSLRADDSGGSWITINGVHVFLGKDGTIEKGPKDFIGRKPNEIGKTGLTKEKESALAQKWIVGEKHAQISNAAAKAVKSGKDAAAKDPVLSAIRNGDKGVLYRGIHVKPGSAIENWKQGQTVQLMPQSFSKSESVAKSFAQQGQDHETQILLKTDASTKGWDLASHLSQADKEGLGKVGVKYSWGKEVISAGAFKVVRINTQIKTYKTGIVSRERKQVVISLKQTGVF